MERDLIKVVKQSPFSEKRFEVELIIWEILFGCPNNAAEWEWRSFVSDLFSFSVMPVEITYMGHLYILPANK